MADYTKYDLVRVHADAPSDIEKKCTVVDWSPGCGGACPMPTSGTDKGLCTLVAMSKKGQLLPWDTVQSSAATHQLFKNYAWSSSDSPAETCKWCRRVETKGHVTCCLRPVCHYCFRGRVEHSVWCDYCLRLRTPSIVTSSAWEKKVHSLDTTCARSDDKNEREDRFVCNALLKMSPEELARYEAATVAEILKMNAHSLDRDRHVAEEKEIRARKAERDARRTSRKRTHETGLGDE